MRSTTIKPARPELKCLVAQAALSLATLDADRLEELSRFCEALKDDLAPEQAQQIAREAHEARQEMATLAKSVEVTRTNLAVMNRLRELKASRMEYAIAADSKARSTEDLHGHN